jgi:hypothetical protein
MFIFNTELLLIGVNSKAHALLVAVVGLAAMFMFASATQGWFFTRNRWWESALLIVAAFSMFRPDFWRDQLFPPYAQHPGIELHQAVTEMSPGDPLRLNIEVENDNGIIFTRNLLLTVPDAPPGNRLQQLGFITENSGDQLKIVDIGFMSPAENAGVETGYAKSIIGYESKLEQPVKYWFVLPPIILAAILGLWQRRRRPLTEP